METTNIPAASNSAMSPTIGAIAKALGQAQSQFSPIKQDKDNPFFKSRFASLGAIIDATKGALAKNGLAVSQLVDTNGVVHVDTLLMHESGEWIRSSISLKPKADDPQSIGSAITYGRRYSLGAILGVASEDDDDGNQSSGKGDQKKPETQPEQPKAPAPAGQPTRKPQVSNPDDPITGPQSKAIHALLTKLNITDDLERMEHISRIAGIQPTVTSTASLTKGEASTVIESLGKELEV